MPQQPDPRRASPRVSPTAPESQSVSASVWGALESIPGFNADLRRAEKELESGGGVLYEVRDGALRKVGKRR